MINILNPNFLEQMPQPLVDLYADLETFIITDIARRLKTAGTTTSTAEWQKKQAELYNINNINQKVAEVLNKSNSEIAKMFQEAALTTIMTENEIFKKAGYKSIDLDQNKALQNYLKTAIKQAKGDIENITQSMGFAEKQGNNMVYNSVAKFYQKELNVAHIKVSSGVQDYSTAIRQAANKISQSGLRYFKEPNKITYESGYSVNVDTATRRAVITSAHQFNQETINYMVNEIVPADEQYVETTAHANARPSHQNWQGRVFKMHGSTTDYPNLEDSTHLGAADGLCGINCRHSYFTFIPGVSARAYTDEDLKNINTPDFEYNGKKYNGYEATQYQRQLENEIRKTKRQLIVYKETGLDDDFKSSSLKLKNLQTEYKTFSQKAGISKKLNRTQTTGFNQSISSQATKAAKEKYNELANQKTQNSAILGFGKRSKNKEAFQKAKNMGEIEQRISNTLEVKNINLGRMKEELGNKYLEGIEVFTKDYPQIKGFLNAFNTKVRSGEYGHFGITASKIKENEKILYSFTNELSLKNPLNISNMIKDYDNDIKNGFHYENMSPKLAAIHECTHAVDSMLSMYEKGAYLNGKFINVDASKGLNYYCFGYSDEIIKQTKQEVFGKQFGEEVYEGTKYLGKYAFASTSEMLAQCVSYEYSGKTNVFSSKVKELFDRKIKEVLK